MTALELRASWVAALRGSRSSRGAVLLLALVARFVAWPFIDGFVWPDGIFQTLEPGRALAGLEGIVVWEWEAGMRPMLAPVVYGALVKVAAVFGLDGPGHAVAAAQFLHILLSLVLVDATYRIARCVAGERVALAAGLLAALFPALLFWAPRTLTDNVSATFVWWAFARFVEAAGKPGRVRDAVIVGLLFGLAYWWRYTTPIFCAGPVVWLLWKRRFRSFFALAGAFLGVVVLAGLIDWLAWSRPFYSLFAYLKFSLFSGRAGESWGTQTMWWYGARLLEGFGPFSYGCAALVCVGLVRLRLVGEGLLVGLVAMSLVGHKEERFLVPFTAGLPLCLTIGAWRIAQIVPKLANRWRATLGASLLAATLASSAYAWMRRDWRPWGEWHAALRFVGRAPDATGVALNHGWWASGGYSALGRNIPLLGDELLLRKSELYETLRHPFMSHLVVQESELRILNDLNLRQLFTPIHSIGELRILRKKSSGE